MSSANQSYTSLANSLCGPYFLREQAVQGNQNNLGPKSVLLSMMLTFAA